MVFWESATVSKMTPDNVKSFGAYPCELEGQNCQKRKKNKQKAKKKKQPNIT